MLQIKAVQEWVEKLNAKMDWSRKGVKPYKDVSNLFEECGEVAREVRRHEDGRDAHDEEEKMTLGEMKLKLTEELGDALYCLATIANRYDISLEEAFFVHKEKMEELYLQD